MKASSTTRLFIIFFSPYLMIFQSWVEYTLQIHCEMRKTILKYIKKLGKNLGFPNNYIHTNPAPSLSAAADGEILVFSSLLDTKLDVLHGREQGATLVGDLFTGTGKNIKKNLLNKSNQSKYYVRKYIIGNCKNVFFTKNHFWCNYFKICFTWYISHQSTFRPKKLFDDISYTIFENVLLSLLIFLKVTYKGSVTVKCKKNLHFEM